MDGRVEVSFRRRCMTASIAAPSGSKARLFEHKEVRVRAGPLGARSAVKSSQPDVGETVRPGANGFGYFPRKESNPRRGTARKKTWMSCIIRRHPTVARRRAPTKAAPRECPAPSQVLTHLASLSRERERGKETGAFRRLSIHMLQALAAQFRGNAITLRRSRAP